MNKRHPLNTLPTPCLDPVDITETETETQMAETRMIASDKTRELKRQCNDQDDGPGTKRLSFTRLFVFPILCGHDTLLYPGVDYLVTTVAGRPALVCGENHTWQRNPAQCLTILDTTLPTLISFAVARQRNVPGWKDW